ncbi:hypothetical protein ACPA9J_14130 [Pseudomonas aeruginosa]
MPMLARHRCHPEAPDLASAFGGRAPRRTLWVGRECLRDAWRELDSAGETRIDLGGRWATRTSPRQRIRPALPRLPRPPQTPGGSAGDHQ